MDDQNEYDEFYEHDDDEQDIAEQDSDGQDGDGHNGDELEVEVDEEQQLPPEPKLEIQQQVNDGNWAVDCDIGDSRTAMTPTKDDKQQFNWTEHPKTREWASSSECELKTLPVPSSSQRKILYQEEKVLEEAILRIQVELAKKRALRSPIRMLPNEVLAAVFVAMHNTPCIYDHWGITQKDFRHNLLLTCKSWRNIALTTPELWSNIKIRPISRAPHYHLSTARNELFSFKRQLDLSGTVPLRIDMENTGDVEVMNALLPHAARIKSLYLTNENYHVLKELRNVDRGLNRLTRLTLLSRSYQGSEGIAVKLPALRFLFIKTRNLGTQWGLDCPVLGEFKLEADSVQTAELQTMMAEMPSLVTFTLEAKFERTVGGETEDFCFEKLTKLSINSGSYYGYDTHVTSNAELAGLILAKAPYLTDLSMCFFEKSFPRPPPLLRSNVQNMTIRLTSSSRGGRGGNTKTPKAQRLSCIRQWFEAVPDLVRLCITGHQKCTDYIACLLEPPKKSRKRVEPLLTKMTSLTLEGVQFEESEILSFSQSRSLGPSGKLKGDITDAVQPCLVTLQRCSLSRKGYYRSFDVEGAKYEDLLKKNFDSPQYTLP